MANLQIKGIDESLYSGIKRLAQQEHRSVSQQVVHVLQHYLATAKKARQNKTAAQSLLALSGAWDDERPAGRIVREIKAGRKNSRKLAGGL